MNIFKNKTTIGEVVAPRNGLNGFKTMLGALVNVAALFIPGVREWVATHPVEYGQLLSLAFILLRVFTNGPVGQKSDPILVQIASVLAELSPQRNGGQPSVEAFPASEAVVAGGPVDIKDLWKNRQVPNDDV